MFELTVDVSGTDGGGGPRSPAFVVDRGEMAGFEIAVAERPLFGEVTEQLSMGKPIAVGSLVSLELGPASEEITSAVEGYQEIDPASAVVTASSYWEATVGETRFALAMNPSTTPTMMRFATQRTYRESIRRVDGLAQHLVPVGIRTSPTIAAVYHDGLLMAAAGGVASVGSWKFEDPVVTIYGSPSAPYHGEFEIVVVESVTPVPSSFWIAFWADWADDFVVGQIYFMGHLYTPAQNPLWPVSGDFLVSQNLIYLFCDRLPFAPRTPSRAATAAQFIGEVVY